MKTAIALRHIAFEDLGTFASVLADHDYRLQYIDSTLDTLPAGACANADLLAVLGAPVGAFDEPTYPFIADELAVVQARLSSGRPLLGICLGAQLIARALGAEVRPMGHHEIGFAPLQLTLDGQASPLTALGDTPVLHWHGDMFDLPAGTHHLASTEACPNQAFARGTQVLALQCHLEADPVRIESWLVGHACELGVAGVDPVALRAAARTLGERLPQAARAVFDSWLRQLQPSG